MPDPKCVDLTHEMTVTLLLSSFNVAEGDLETSIGSSTIGVGFVRSSIVCVAIVNVWKGIVNRVGYRPLLSRAQRDKIGITGNRRDWCWGLEKSRANKSAGGLPSETSDGAFQTRSIIQMSC